MAVDITSTFKQIAITIEPPLSSSSSLRKRKNKTTNVSTKRQPKDEFTKEAYRVAAHIHSLRIYLYRIRRAYLSSSKRPISRSSSVHISANPQNTLNLSSSSSSNTTVLLSALRITDSEVSEIFKLGDDVSYLSDKQKDEIDLNCKLFIARCMEQVKKLTAIVDQSRKTLPKDLITDSMSSKLLNWMDPSISEFREASMQHQFILLGHYNAIVWLLSAWLMEVSKFHRQQQEKRVQREMERHNSPITPLPSTPPLLPSTLSSSPKSNLMSTSSSLPIQEDEDLYEEDDDIENSLSTQEKMLLESENREIMNRLESKLEHVRQAESTLLEIANIQTQLSHHLSAQSSVITQLYNDATLQTDNVREGNKYLVKAQKRGSDSRIIVLVILIVLTFVLLFLDWYD
ncbi:hypothetical protein BKA69DRAFT_1179205 [Paraphysoderma sedebokerense]|nr:hypothetical protein BKA69DRAFT_1179205 [Paraphysoderma sedebokerense]